MVFVPAIMGAGIVFSTTTLVSDVLAHGTRTVLARRTRIRGRMVAATVLDPEEPQLVEASHPVARSVILLVGFASAVFGIYVAIGATGNFLREDGYTERIAWIWAASLLAVTASWVFAAACLTVATRRDHAPAWAWNMLVASPLLGVEQVASTELGRATRIRWVVVGSATATTLLTVLATWPHVLRPVDRRMADLFDQNALSVLDAVGHVAGSTPLTVLVAGGLGIATLRCRRLAWVFISTIVASFTVTAILRVLAQRPRPVDGPLAGRLDSFPSGHLVQITVLAVLVPLAIYELTGSRTFRRWTRMVLAATVMVVAISRINSGHHFATDVAAGVAIGSMVGGWGALAVLVPGSHCACRRCRTARGGPT